MDRLLKIFLIRQINGRIDADEVSVFQLLRPPLPGGSVIIRRLSLDAPIYMRGLNSNCYVYFSHMNIICI